MLFSEPKIPQLLNERDVRWAILEFQCSSASRKFLNDSTFGAWSCSNTVSVLFSEPKIPQYYLGRLHRCGRRGFSALQRAENSSIEFEVEDDDGQPVSFSALQRAENSSMARSLWGYPTLVRFSALQRAENSSMRSSARR